jgi:flagellar assembly protein FliH
MATPIALAARRPRFLADVPAAPAAEPARFGVAAVRAAPVAVPAAPPPQAVAPAAAPPPAPAPPGAAEIAAARREALERVAAALDTLRAQADRLAEQARSDALEIGFQVARKILEAEIRHSPDALFALVRSAVRRAGESRRVAVRLAPEDAALVQSDAGRAALDGLTAARIEIFPDASMQRGDCAIDTDFGQVDGRLGTRLAELRRAVDAAGEGAA